MGLGSFRYHRAKRLAAAESSNDSVQAVVIEPVIEAVVEQVKPVQVVSPQPQQHNQNRHQQQHRR